MAVAAIKKLGPAWKCHGARIYKLSGQISSGEVSGQVPNANRAHLVPPLVGAASRDFRGVPGGSAVVAEVQCIRRERMNSRAEQ